LKKITNEVAKEQLMVASLYGVDEEEKTIWVLIEQIDGVLESVSLEILSKGRRLADDVGWSLVGLLIGHGVKSLTDEIFEHGADEIWLVDRPQLEHFTVDAYTHVAYQAIMEGHPSVFLCGATVNGRDLAGRLAVRLKTGLNADCTDLRLNSKTGVLTSEVTGFGGGVIALLESPAHRPQMSTVRPGVFTMDEPLDGREGKVNEIQVNLKSKLIRSQIIERVTGEGVDLIKAPVLICGGRGIGGNFTMLENLASLLDGEVGATRPPVDEGHIERERQVGQTGVVCRPKIAFAFGISGAFHFWVGIQNSDIVVAVNSDPEAPIFEYADYCIVGDALQIVPALINAFQTLQEVSDV
jgi:electron transfer flavoprotein alpha subunit